MNKEINLLSKTVITASSKSTEIISLILKNRHITDINEFISPSYPKLSLKLNSSVKLINEIIKNNGNILIYGDYDVDGITATAILWQSLYKNYINVIPFVPHREKDGYGIKAASFFRFQEEKGIKFDLLITVDNGIVADKELAKIKAKQDIKIIVTDHHLPSSDRSRPVTTDATIHSTLVSGAALSWFLAREFDPDADLGLAALGAVADCLPLTGINRSIVVHGLRKINANPSIGINKLIQISSIQLPVTTYHLGFLLGPRINAVGRLSDPTDALRLLCSQNSLQASKYAVSLNSFNQDRQLLQSDSMQSAEEIFRRDGIDAVSDKIKNKIIIISGDYNAGIIGLISGRLTEKYYLPSIVISADGEIAKGSCRSIPELNIIDALREHSNLFVDLGGHAGAAGFSIFTKNIPKLQKVLTKSVNQKLKKINLIPHLDVDAEMEIGAVTLENIKLLEQLAPFGIGNPEPLFLFKNQIVQDVRTIGKTSDHLKLKLNYIDAIAFKKGDMITKLKIGDPINIVASLSENTWNNHTTPQLIIKEILI